MGELCRLNGIDDPSHHRLKVGATLVVTATRS